MDQNNTDTNAQNAVPQQPEAPAPQPQAEPKPAQANAYDRTREEFEKLLESNRRLFEDNRVLRQKVEQRPAPAQQVSQRPQSNVVNPNDFVEKDPITGESYINEQRLRARIEENEKRAIRAEQVIQSYVKSAEEREIERMNKEAFQAHPELEPGSEKFDAGFNKQVRGVLTDSMFNPDDYNGRPLSFKEAADLVRNMYPKAQQPVVDAKAEKEQQVKSQAAQTLKEQASTQAQSQPRGIQQSTDDEELEALRYRTRYHNDSHALAKRLMHTEHIAVNKDDR